MDESRLRELMADAPGNPPPAAFGIDEVRAVSRRAAKRHREGIAAVSAVAVVLLAGVVFSGNIADTGSADPRTVSAPAGSGTAAWQNGTDPGKTHTDGQRRPGTASAQNSPGPKPKQGGNGSRGNGPSRAERTGRCDKVGRELVDALADELPPTDDDQVLRCAPEGHAVSVQVDGGTVTAWLSDSEVSDTHNQPPGAFSVVRRTSAGTLSVMSIPGRQEYGAPLSAKLPRIATAVANAL